MNAVMHVTVRLLTAPAITIQFQVLIPVADASAAIVPRRSILKVLTENVAAENSYMTPAINARKLIPAPTVLRCKRNIIPDVCVRTAMPFVTRLIAYTASATPAATTVTFITAAAAATPDITSCA